MWQNKIRLLWDSVKNANPANLVCQDKTYSDLVLDLKKLDQYFSNKENLKIAIVTEKSYASLVSILFCFFKGHTFIPIFQGSKNSNTILDIVSADHVLTTADISEILSDDSASANFMVKDLKPDDIAYIISTSGTTGKPKLIPITYANFSAYLDAILPIVKAPKTFCLLQNFEISFDPYLFDLAMTIYNQSYLLPIPHSDLRRMADTLDAIKDDVWISLTPGQGDLLSSLLPKKIWPSVKRTFFMGEKLKSSLCNDWMAHFPSSDIYNMYGPAETTVTVSYHLFDSASDTYSYVPIGNIHAGHDFKITDDNELLIKGPQVFGGYLGGPKTEIWFNTHDTIEIIDSKLYITGRSDFQVKINGRRFQPEEMELALKTAGLNGIVVPITEFQKRKDKTHLVFITVDSSVEMSDILKALQTRYDIDFIPKRIIHIKQYPLSQNGKIDRNLLHQEALKTEPK